MTDPALSRRGVLRGAAVVALGAAGGIVTVVATRAGRDRSASAAANAYGPPGSTGRLLVPLDRIPLGGGIVLDRDEVVLTRTSTGDVHAFSAVCTHQGCVVDTVARGAIGCPCHGSRFDADTGAVTRGPATRPLAEIAVAVRAGKVYTT